MLMLRDCRRLLHQEAGIQARGAPPRPFPSRAKEGEIWSPRWLASTLPWMQCTCGGGPVNFSGSLLRPVRLGTRATAPCTRTELHGRAPRLGRARRAHHPESRLFLLVRVRRPSALLLGVLSLCEVVVCLSPMSGGAQDEYLIIRLVLSMRARARILQLVNFSTISRLLRFLHFMARHDRCLPGPLLALCARGLVLPATDQ